VVSFTSPAEAQKAAANNTRKTQNNIFCGIWTSYVKIAVKFGGAFAPLSELPFVIPAKAGIHNRHL
jgi:hypothetical protein